MRIK
jgi:hypothetical protein